MIRVGFKSDRGIKRDNNEDSCFVMPKEHIYIVADGVGGNNSGETASNLAVSSIAEYVKSRPMEKVENDEEICMYLKDCIEIANRKIIASAMGNIENRGMATTIVICHVREGKAYFANAGDSRGYIYRNGSLCQITQDHTFVNALVRDGVITEEEAVNHERKNELTKALGADNEVGADYYQTDIEKGDVILLCTDGLYNEVPIEKIEEAMEYEDNMLNLAEILINRANKYGGRDNITAVCLKIEGGVQHG